jgi:hypothetical protein
MTDYIALEAPAWAWIGACLTLLVAGLAFGALAAYALRIAAALDRIDDYEDIAAKKSDVQREFAEVHGRLDRLERPEPQPIRYEPPATLKEPASVELSENTDVHPCLPWHTHVSHNA